MGDRELLELAAKAAGIESPAGIRSDNTWWWYNGCMDGEGRKWNPLTDDGDALRLAERCSLTVCMNGTGTVSACDEYRKDDVFATQSIHECGGSRITATRRAIVRAAANIGEAMQ